MYLDKNKLTHSKCFLWVSINKPLDLKFWQDQIEYLKNNFSEVIVLIADKIDIINQINIENKKYQEALDNTKNKFNLWKEFLLKRIKTIAKENKESKLGYEWIKNKFCFICREDISNTKRFKDIYSILENKYINESSFKEEVWDILKNYLNARWKHDIIWADLLEKISGYILNELVTLIDGIDYKDNNYSCIVYTTFKETIWWMNKLAEKTYNSFDKKIKLRWELLVESCIY